MNRTLKSLSYFKTGGSCDRFSAPKDPQTLATDICEARVATMPIMVLGAGSNSLVLDQHFPGLVIKLDAFKGFERISETRVKVGAGWENSDLVLRLRSEGLFGLEWMYRLPGQLGGTARMNARCYGGEISQFAAIVRAVDLKGQLKEYSGESCFYGYKDTLMMQEGGVVYEVELELSTADSLGEDKMRFVEADRQSKKQFDYPTCGCVFKNNYHPDISVSSGLLLEIAGAKSLSEKGAKVSPFHANFIWNMEEASSDDILKLSLSMRDLVYEYFGVWLEYEMEVLGELPESFDQNLSLIKPFKPTELQKSRLVAARKQFQNR